jgi:hypoxanthine phosphoribosyltransferase
MGKQMNDAAREALAAMRSAERLYTMEEIGSVCDRLAQSINADLGDDELTVLCIMNGGLVATGLLLPRLRMPLRVDYLHATRYRERTSGEELHWRVEPANDLAGRRVLVIDDILDEGYTLAAIMDFCDAQGARSVDAAVLVQKVHERGVRPPVAYIGLTVPDRYVFGAGMDYKGYWRNAPGIFAVAGS